MDRIKKIKNSIIDILIDVVVLIISISIFFILLSSGYDESIFMSMLSLMIVISLLSMLYNVIKIIVLFIGELIFKE
jgi:hypothetical protein